MIALIDDYQKVDMFTPDAGLADLILGDYPERFIPDTQYHLDTSESGVTMYCFYDLRKGALVPLLTERGQGYLYEIRLSLNGEFVAGNPKG